MSAGRYLWCYLYRAIDKESDTIDFMLAKYRAEVAAKAFFAKAFASSGLPEKITIDKSGANKAGIDAINFQLIVLSLLGCALLQIKIRQTCKFLISFSKFIQNPSASVSLSPLKLKSDL